jgi:hypothetical protein
MVDATDVIRQACEAIASGNEAEARDLLRREYPFTPCRPVQRSWTKTEALRLFIRDGFIDRYSGQRLIFPVIFRALSKLLPAEFPTHPNWRMTETHIAY